MTWRKTNDAGNWKRKHLIAIYGGYGPVIRQTRDKSIHGPDILCPVHNVMWNRPVQINDDLGGWASIFFWKNVWGVKLCLLVNWTNIFQSVTTLRIPHQFRESNRDRILTEWKKIFTQRYLTLKSLMSSLFTLQESQSIFITKTFFYVVCGNIYHYFVRSIWNS